MAVENRFEAYTIVASQDLTGHQYKAVGLDGLVASTVVGAKGILLTKPRANEHATIAYKGYMKGYVGAAVNSGGRLGVTNSGFLTPINSGDYVGIALASAASGAVCSFVGDFNMGLAG